jgi:histidyl-tRNA synthetase
MDAMQKRRWIEERIRKTFESFGYQEALTPTIESLELFTAKSGEGIIQEMYTFKDKGGRSLALRPEITASVIRFYVNELQQKPKPLKLFYFGNCFRYDRPQKARYREFWQAGCELIGVGSPEAYAELIALGVNLLKEAGLKQLKLRIGHLKVLTKMMEEIGLPTNAKRPLMRLIDKRDFDGIRSKCESLGVSKTQINRFMDFLGCRNLKEVKSFLEFISSRKWKEAFDAEAELEAVLKGLNYFGIKDWEVDFGIARNLDYYTGLVFEIDAPILGAEKQLCGGGAYKLVRLFGGKDLPQAGFAIGFDRTFLALEAERYEFKAKRELDYYIVPISKDLISHAIGIGMKLRSKGKKVDIELMYRNPNRAFEYANSIGKEEVKKGVVSIRDMETGEQKEVNRERI